MCAQQNEMQIIKNKNSISKRAFSNLLLLNEHTRASSNAISPGESKI